MLQLIIITVFLIYTKVAIAQQTCSVDDLFNDMRLSVDLSPNKLAKDLLSTKDCFGQVQAKTKLKPVTEVLESNWLGGVLDSEESRSVFIMLNGENEGVELEILNMGCLGTLAFVAGLSLTDDLFKQQGPLRLYSIHGTPVSSVEEVKTSHFMLHLLFKDETFVWPGVKLDHSWKIGNSELRTVSLSPKVIQVMDFLSEAEMNSLLDCGEDRLFRSPEKHYSEDDRFKNYRTSETGNLPESKCRHARTVRQRSQQVSRLPSLNMVEPLQLLKYTPGKWYKSHQDLFHHPKNEIDEVDYDGESISQSLRQFSYKWREKLFLASKEYFSGHKSSDFHEFAAELLLSQRLKQYSPNEANSEFQQIIGSLLGVTSKIELLSLLEQDNIAPETEAAWIINAYNTWRSSSTPVVSAPEVLSFFSVFDDHSGMFPSVSVERNRFLTVLPYLTDVSKGGGETAFPEAVVSQSDLPKNKFGLSECERGVLVPSKRGSAALFYHQTGNGKRDERSSHAGCPPYSEIKYAINIFCWNLDWRRGIERFS